MHTSLQKFCACAVLGLATAFTGASAQDALPVGMSAGPKMGGIEEFRLPNGFRVLLMEDRSQPLITTNITYLVGSRHEGYGEAGMAHLLEHLVFKGTPKRRDIKSEFTRRGARWNGTTYYDRTNYFLTFASTRENLEWAIDLEADRMVNSFISKADLDSEMTVVRNEFEMGENNPLGVLSQRVSRAAYQWHNYGRPTIGNKSDIENVPIERLQAFYRQYYQPDNAVMVIAGDFDPAVARAMIAKHFGALPKPARALIPTYTNDAPQDGEREVFLRRTGETQAFIMLYHVPPGTHPDYAASDVLALVLGDTPTGRLHKALVETKIATGVSGSDRMLAERGALVFSASAPKSAAAQPMRDVLIRTVEGLASNPITADETERAKQRILTQMDVSLTKTHQFATGLTEWIALGDWRFFFRYRDHVFNVTAEKVNEAARRYLISSNRTIGQFIPVDQAPARAEPPAAPDLQVALKDFTGPPGIAGGEAFDLSIPNIEARTTRFTLPNGLKVAFLPKKSRGGMVNAQLAFQYGTEDSKFNRGNACGYAGSMLMRGTRSKSREEIRNEITRLRAQVSVGGGGASVEAPATSLADSLKLVAEILREPRFDAAEFDQLKRASIAGIESARNDPSALASLALSRHHNPHPRGHWNYSSSLEEQLEDARRVGLSEARRCYEEFFGLSQAQLGIAGDFDPVAMRTLVTQLFGDFKKSVPYQRIPAKSREATPLSDVIRTPDKANAVLRANVFVPMRDDDADYAPLALANYLFGGSIDARLSKRIREKEGLSYSVGSGLSVGALDKHGFWSASAIYAPQNREKVEAAFREELALAREKGFTATEVSQAKESIMQQRKLGRASDAALAGRLIGDLFNERTYLFEAGLEERMQKATTEEVNAAFRKYIDPAKLNLVRAGDFK